MSALAKSFDALEVGDRFVTSGRTLTEADVVGFAALTGDMHPQHVDAEWAGRSDFGERVAHGLLVLSYAAGLVRFDPARVVALRGIGEAVFKRPAHLGDTVRVEGEISSKRPLDGDRGFVTVAWRIVNQRGQRVVLATVDVVWRREGEAGRREGREHLPRTLPL